MPPAAVPVTLTAARGLEGLEEDRPRSGRPRVISEDAVSRWLEASTGARGGTACCYPVDSAPSRALSEEAIAHPSPPGRDRLPFRTAESFGGRDIIYPASAGPC